MPALNVIRWTNREGSLVKTNQVTRAGVFAVGDMGREQSLVIRAIRKGAPSGTRCGSVF